MGEFWSYLKKKERKKDVIYPQWWMDKNNWKRWTFNSIKSYKYFKNQKYTLYFVNIGNLFLKVETEILIVYLGAKEKGIKLGRTQKQL